MWSRFAGWPLSRQQGPDSPRTPDDFYCLALGHRSGQGPFQGKDPVKAAGHARTAAERSHAGAQGLLGFFLSKGIGVKNRYEAYQAWVLRRNEYDECRRLNGSSCRDPGPAPQ